MAAITGYALGGGLEIALGCDRRIGGDNAKLGQPEILLGVIPGGGGTQRLARLVGPARAKDLIYTGRIVDAPEALAIGLVDEIVPPDDVYARARAWAEQFADGPGAGAGGGEEGDRRRAGPRPAHRAGHRDRPVRRAVRDRGPRIGMASFVENGPGKAKFTGR